MCTEEQHREKMDKLEAILKCLLKRKTIDRDIPISATLAWNIDYMERRHIFLWSSGAVSLSVGEYGTVAIPATTWTPFPFRPGVPVTIPASATSTIIQARFADEDAP